MRNDSRRWAVLGAVIVTLVSGAARPSSAQSARIPTPTAGMVLFGRLEREIINATNQRDAAKLDMFVAPNFMLQVGTLAGTMVARSDWIAQSLREAVADSRIERMTVRDVNNDLSVANFVWVVNAGEAKPVAISVVDVWAKSGTGEGDWRLKIRYATPTVEDVHVPGSIR